MSSDIPEKREGRSLADQRRPSQICDLWQASQVFSTTSLPICQVFRLDPPPISLDHAVFVPRRKREGGAHAERLPNRRAAELIDFEHDGRRWTATVGRFSDGRIAEVFIDGPKESPIVRLAQDGALAASLALQSGCPLETLRHALSGREAGPLRTALALIEETGQ